MDGPQFDDFARKLTGLASRRRVLGGLLGVAAGAMVAGEAGAQVRRATCRSASTGCTRNAQCCSGLCATSRSLPRNRRNRCVCPSDLATCGGGCVDLATDESHCGACGEACDTGAMCISGVCDSSICSTYQPPVGGYGGPHFCLDQFAGISVIVPAPCSGLEIQMETACTSSSSCSTLPDRTTYCITTAVPCQTDSCDQGVITVGDANAGVCAYLPQSCK
jgi:hypothetical protein